MPPAVNAATVRGVAQPGSVLAWGARGPEFKSRRPDQSIFNFRSIFQKLLESL